MGWGVDLLNIKVLNQGHDRFGANLRRMMAIGMTKSLPTASRIGWFLMWSYLPGWAVEGWGWDRDAWPREA